MSLFIIVKFLKIAIKKIYNYLACTARKSRKNWNLSSKIKKLIVSVKSILLLKNKENFNQNELKAINLIKLISLFLVILCFYYIWFIAFLSLGIWRFPTIYMVFSCGVKLLLIIWILIIQITFIYIIYKSTHWFQFDKYYVICMRNWTGVSENKIGKWLNSETILIVNNEVVSEIYYNNLNWLDRLSSYFQFYILRNRSYTSWECTLTGILFKVIPLLPAVIIYQVLVVIFEGRIIDYHYSNYVNFCNVEYNTEGGKLKLKNILINLSLIFISIFIGLSIIPHLYFSIDFAYYSNPNFYLHFSQRRWTHSVIHAYGWIKINIIHVHII